MIEYEGQFTPSKNKVKRKRLYSVYKHEIHMYNGLGEDADFREFVGQTTATSAKRAAAHVAHRFDAPVYTEVPWWGDGCRITIYEAEVAEDDNSGGYKTTGRKAQKP